MSRFDELRAIENEIGPLRDDPRLNALRDVVAEFEQNFLKSVTTKIAAGTVIDQRWLDERRGWIRGAKEILDEPFEVERKLQNELAKQGG